MTGAASALLIATRAIDAALTPAGKDQAWLHRKIQGAPFSRRTPIEYMVAHGMEGMAL